MAYQLVEQHAREKAGQGPEWEPWLLESYPKTNGPRLFMQLTGAVAPRFTKGPRKGRRNWKKKDKATERVIVITPAEQESYEAAWEQDTARCSQCMGEGKTIASSSSNGDRTYRPCRKCGGDGLAKVAETVGATA
jgi:hypothetical protein